MKVIAGPTQYLNPSYDKHDIGHLCFVLGQQQLDICSRSAWNKKEENKKQTQISPGFDISPLY